jgi:cell wall-associated NlpC family hydrolase
MGDCRFPSILAGLCALAFLSFDGCMPASRSAHADREEYRASIALLEAAASGEGIDQSQRLIVISAMEWIGVPYRYGGTGQEGVDCSGFVRSVFGDVGETLPRTSHEQSCIGDAVSRTLLRTGDLLFFETGGNGVSHVGIAIGADRFVHASTSRGVIVSSLDESYYAERFLFARRVL